MDTNMRDGVYINSYKDTSNLFTVENGKFEDGDSVSAFDYSMEWKLKNKELIIVYMNEVEYLGEL